MARRAVVLQSDSRPYMDAMVLPAALAATLLETIVSLPRVVLAGHGWPLAGDWQAELKKRLFVAQS